MGKTIKTHPLSIDEALAARDAGAVIYAGGTDLMIGRDLHAHAGRPPEMIFLNAVSKLNEISSKNNKICIGAMASMAEVAAHPYVPEVLRQACQSVGSPALRNQATIGGNICTASPAGDSLCALYLCGAEVELRSCKNKRCLPIGDFIRGPGKTALKDDEILTAVYLPSWNPDISAYRKVTPRMVNTIARLSMAAALWVDHGIISRAGISLGAVGPTVIRCRELEAALTKTALAKAVENAQRFAEMAKSAICPIDDHRSSAQYRRNVAANLVYDFLQRAGSPIKQEVPGG